MSETKGVGPVNCDSMRPLPRCGRQAIILFHYKPRGGAWDSSAFCPDHVDRARMVLRRLDIEDRYEEPIPDPTTPGRQR